MSENWQIAVIGIMIGVIQLLLAGILSWLAVELRRLNHELSYRVHNKECDRRMKEHERRLTLLERKKNIMNPSNLAIFSAIASILFLSGCTATNNLSEGIAGKSISGSGTIMISRAGLDKTTQTPELFNLLVVGDYNSIANGDELIRVEYSEDASVFNSNAVTRRYKLVFSSSDQSRIDKALSDANKALEKLTTPSK